MRGKNVYPWHSGSEGSSLYQAKPGHPSVALLCGSTASVVRKREEEWSIVFQPSFWTMFWVLIFFKIWHVIPLLLLNNESHHRCSKACTSSFTQVSLLCCWCCWQQAGICGKETAKSGTQYIELSVSEYFSKEGIETKMSLVIHMQCTEP